MKNNLVLLFLCCFMMVGFSQEQKQLPDSIDLVNVKPTVVLDHMFTSHDMFKKELKGYPILFKNTHTSENYRASNGLASMLSSNYKKNMQIELDEMMFNFKDLVGIYKNRISK